MFKYCLHLAMMIGKVGMATLQTGMRAAPAVKALPSSTRSRVGRAFLDLVKGFRMRELWIFLGWREVQKQYSRSLLGPLWVTISMGVMIAGLGTLYTQIFVTPVHDYLPYLTVGFLVWGLISGVLIGSCAVFASMGSAIRQVNMPLSLYIYQLMWTQLVIFAHNFIIYLIVAVVFEIWPGFGGLMFLPALALLILNGIFAGMVLGPLCARFRDVPMIVASVLQVAFFMTPIIWNASQIPARSAFVQFNPFYHLIEITRNPLLGKAVAQTSWLVCLGMTATFGFVAVLFFARFRARVAYWV